MIPQKTSTKRPKRERVLRIQDWLPRFTNNLSEDLEKVSPGRAPSGDLEYFTGKPPIRGNLLRGQVLRTKSIRKVSSVGIPTRKLILG